MESAEILTIVTILVSWILGVVAKKVSWFQNYLIPIQNIVIGVIFALVEFFITHDFNLAIAASGLLAGGAYDVFKNGKELLATLETKIKGDKEEKGE